MNSIKKSQWYEFLQSKFPNEDFQKFKFTNQSLATNLDNIRTVFNLQASDEWEYHLLLHLIYQVYNV